MCFLSRAHGRVKPSTVEVYNDNSGKYIVISYLEPWPSVAPVED